MTNVRLLRSVLSAENMERAIPRGTAYNGPWRVGCEDSESPRAGNAPSCGRRDDSRNAPWRVPLDDPIITVPYLLYASGISRVFASSFDTVIKMSASKRVNAFIEYEAGVYARLQRLRLPNFPFVCGTFYADGLACLVLSPRGDQENGAKAYDSIVPALKALHSEAKIVHGDLRLENIIFKDELPMLIDFAFSKDISPISFLPVFKSIYQPAVARKYLKVELVRFVEALFLSLDHAKVAEFLCQTEAHMTKRRECPLTQDVDTFFRSAAVEALKAVLDPAMTPEKSEKIDLLLLQLKERLLAHIQQVFLDSIEADLLCIRQELLAAVHVCPALSTLLEEDTFRGLKLTASTAVLQRLALDHHNPEVHPEDDLESLVKAIALKKYGDVEPSLSGYRWADQHDAESLLEFWQKFEAEDPSKMIEKALVAARACDYAKLQDLLGKI